MHWWSRLRVNEICPVEVRVLPLGVAGRPLSLSKFAKGSETMGMTSEGLGEMFAARIPKQNCVSE